MLIIEGLGAFGSVRPIELGSTVEHPFKVAVMTEYTPAFRPRIKISPLLSEV